MSIDIWGLGHDDMVTRYAGVLKGPYHKHFFIPKSYTKFSSHHFGPFPELMKMNNNEI
jgi:hypothetical protein